MWYIHICVCVYTTSSLPTHLLIGTSDVSFYVQATFFFFGCAGSSLLHRLFSSVASGGSSPAAVHCLLTVVSSLVVERGL